MKLRLKAPAKINLGLRIRKRLKNGFHEVETIYTQINLFDLIEIEEINRNLINFPDKNNLVYRAAKLVKDELRIKLGIKIKLEKKIPMGSGLGGGSSDAATVLKGLNQLWQLKLSQQELINLAKKLGSDVAYFIKAGTQLEIQGGEKAGRFIDMGRLVKGWLVVCWPEIKITSQEAYQNIEYDKIGKNEVLWFNDFEIWTFKRFPEIKKIKDLMIKNGAEHSLMSGKGSAVWGVYNKRKTAAAGFKKLKQRYKNSWLLEV